MGAMKELYIQICETAGLDIEDEASLDIIQEASQRVDMQSIESLQTLPQNERIALLAEMTAAQIGH